MTAWVLDGNRRGRTFYEKMGFAEDGMTKVESRKGFDLHEVRYALRLVRFATDSS